MIINRELLITQFGSLDITNVQWLRQPFILGWSQPHWGTHLVRNHPHWATQVLWIVCTPTQKVLFLSTWSIEASLQWYSCLQLYDCPGLYDSPFVCIHPPSNVIACMWALLACKVFPNHNLTRRIHLCTPQDGRKGVPKLEASTFMARRRYPCRRHAVIQVPMSMHGMFERENPRPSHNSKAYLQQ